MKKEWYEKKGRRKGRVDWQVMNSSSIDYAYRCLRYFYLMRVEKIPKSERITPYYFVKGGLWHRTIEHFFDRLGTLEEIESRENQRKKQKDPSKKQYHDPQSFADYMTKEWGKIVNADRRYRQNQETEKMITWFGDYRPYQIKEQMQSVAISLFPILVQQGRPDFSEFEFKNVKLEGLVVNGEKIGTLKLNGKIDELRVEERDGKKVVVIRDYKTGDPYVSQTILENDPQFTFYNLLICCKCFRDEEFAKRLGLENVRHMFNGNPYFVYPEIEHEYFMVEAQARIDYLKKPPQLPDFAEKGKRKYESQLEKFRAGRIKTQPDLEGIQKQQVKAYQRALRIWKDTKKRVKTLPQVIYRTRRDNRHFYDLVKLILDIKDLVLDGKIPTQIRKDCSMCEAKIGCEKRRYQSNETPVHRDGNMMFEFARQPYDKVIEVSTDGFSTSDSLDSYVSDEGEEDGSESQTSSETKKFFFGRKEAWRGKDK